MASHHSRLISVDVGRVLETKSPRYKTGTLTAIDCAKSTEAGPPDKLQLFLQRVEAPDDDPDLVQELKDAIGTQTLLKEGHLVRRQGFQKLPRYCALIGHLFVVCKEQKVGKQTRLVIKQLMALPGAQLRPAVEKKEEKNEKMSFILQFEDNKVYLFVADDEEWYHLIEVAVAEPAGPKKAPNPRLIQKALFLQMEQEVTAWLAKHNLKQLDDISKVTSFVLLLLGLDVKQGHPALEQLKIELMAFSPPPGFTELAAWKKTDPTVETEDPELKHAKEQNLQIMCDKLDVNKDNKISYTELGATLAHLGLKEAEVKQLFETLDKDKLGYISADAVKAHFLPEMQKQPIGAAVAEPEGPSQSQILELKAVFNLLDRDGSGTIDGNELEAIVKALGANNVSRTAIDKLIASIDVDGNGSIDFEEFCQMVTAKRSVFGLFDMTKLWVLEQALVHNKGVSPFMMEKEKHFPGSLPEHDFVNKVAVMLAKRGFVHTQCIACVSLCRDEITGPLLTLIQEKFCSSFTFTSLGGSLTCGKTGFSAAHHHAPIVNGREKYLYFAMPHIAIDAFGDVGVVRRPGRTKESTACGALVAFRSQILSGHVDLGIDPHDIEMSILKQKIFSVMPYGAKPSLVELTKYTLDAILADLRVLIGLTVDTNHSDYAVITGVQIHGPKWLDAENRPMAGDIDYVWPGEMYCVVRGVKTTLTFDT